MKVNRIALSALLAAVLAVAINVVAYAGLTRQLTSLNNTFGLGTMPSPGTPTTIHPNALVANNGFVKLTWNTAGNATIDAAHIQSYSVVRAPAATASPAYSSIELINLSGAPAVGPSGTGSGGGTLAAGSYTIGYTYVSAAGETLASPASAAISVPATGKITTASITFPTGVTSLNWYLLSGTSATGLAGTQTSSGTFAISAPGNLGPPPACTSSTCTYTDPTASYNSQYDYAVQANFKSWSSLSTGEMALSLSPTSGSDDTTAGPNYNSVWVNSNNLDVWVVGDNGRVACSSNAKSASPTWIDVTPATSVGIPPGTALRFVDSKNSKAVWAVGDGGIIITGNASCDQSRVSWSLVTDPDPQKHSLRAVSNLPNSNTSWAVGDGGTILYSPDASATTWFNVASPTTGVNFRGVSVTTTSGGANVYIVGDGGAMYFGTCTTPASATSVCSWHNVAPGTNSNTLYAVTAVRPSVSDSIWAVGAQGTILYSAAGCTGSPVTCSWKDVSGGATAQSLYSVYATSTSAVWTVGGAGVALFSAGCTITPLTCSWSNISPTVNAYAFDLYGTSSGTASDVWAVGQGGQVFYSTAATPSQTSWTAVSPSPIVYGGLVPLSSASLTALQTIDPSRYQNVNTWPVAAGSSSTYVEFDWSPTILGGATVSSVVLTLNFRIDQVPNNPTFQVIVSTNGGTTFGSPVGITPGFTAANQDQTVSLTLTGVTDVSNLKIRFQAGTGPGTAFHTAFDLVHLDVN